MCRYYLFVLAILASGALIGLPLLAIWLILNPLTLLILIGLYFLFDWIFQTGRR